MNQQVMIHMSDMRLQQIAEAAYIGMANVLQDDRRVAAYHPDALRLAVLPD